MIKSRTGMEVKVGLWGTGHGKKNLVKGIAEYELDSLWDWG